MVVLISEVVVLCLKTKGLRGLTLVYGTSTITIHIGFIIQLVFKGNLAVIIFVKYSGLLVVLSYGYKSQLKYGGIGLMMILGFSHHKLIQWVMCYAEKIYSCVMNYMVYTFEELKTNISILVGVLDDEICTLFPYPGFVPMGFSREGFLR